VSKNKDFVFEGFRYPRYTQVPDELFDVLMPDLTEAEIKCLLYVIRRTFGFRKESDAIATKQFIEGIVTRDGRQLDRGTGLSSKGVWSGLKGLEEKGIIEVARRVAPDGDYEINVYSLKFHVSERGVPTLGSNPYYLRKEPVTTSGSIQETVEQETVEQETDLSKPPPSSNLSTPNEEDIEELISPELEILIETCSREFDDMPHLESNQTRAFNLWAKTRYDAAEMLVRTRQARETTKLRIGSSAVKNRQKKMAYFFAVLEDVLGLKQAKS